MCRDLTPLLGQLAGLIQAADLPAHLRAADLNTVHAMSRGVRMIEQVLSQRSDAFLASRLLQIAEFRMACQTALRQMHLARERRKRA